MDKVGGGGQGDGKGHGRARCCSGQVQLQLTDQETATGTSPRALRRLGRGEWSAKASHSCSLSLVPKSQSHT